eukprot:gene6840-4285_t
MAVAPPEGASFLKGVAEPDMPVVPAGTPLYVTDTEPEHTRFAGWPIFTKTPPADEGNGVAPIGVTFTAWHPPEGEGQELRRAMVVATTGIVTLVGTFKSDIRAGTVISKHAKFTGLRAMVLEAPPAASTTKRAVRVLLLPPAAG